MAVIDNRPESREGRGATALLLLLLAFVVALALHGLLSRGGLDRYGDMYENYAWGVLWQWGTFKHPPLFGWITALWFEIFPHTDWFYYLLASLNNGVALFALWRISTRYGGPGFQLVTLVVAMLMPPLSFLALNYNANSAMTPFWAGVFLFYLRGIEKRRLVDAVILGLLAAGAMLSKYHSAVLLAGLFLHALVDREARPVLFSAFGLVVLAVFAAASAPHLVWLVNHDFLPITYAASQTGPEDQTILSYLVFLIVPFGYSALGLAAAASLRRWRDGAPVVPLAGLAALRKTVQGRALLTFALAPLLLTLVMGAAVDADLSPVWQLPFYPAFALVVALLVPPAIAEARAGQTLAIGAVFCVVLVAVGPIWRPYELAQFGGYLQVPMQRLAAEIDTTWAEEAGGADRPLVTGDYLLVNSTVFYSRFRPVSTGLIDDSAAPFVTPEAMKQGLIVICYGSDDGCQARAAEAAGTAAIRQTLDLTGRDGASRHRVEIWYRKPAA